MEELYEKLSKYHRLDIYPMHMPGHKRNTAMMSENELSVNDIETGIYMGLAAACQLDITEIDGFDNLGAPESILKDAMERAARLYHSDKTYFLVNGSTVGLLAGIMGCTKKNDKVLIARNCHKAVYNALYLNELRPIYLYPKLNRELDFYEEVSPEEVEEQLKANPEISLVVITSPTYEGVVSDISTIARIVHNYGKLLLVDEAHGAHFGFHSYFPTSSLLHGADIVVQSLHKTMPAFTQTALLHIKGNRASVERIGGYLSMLQSSSPSYVLMASMDYCIGLMEARGQQLFEAYAYNLKELDGRLSGLKNLSIYKGPNRNGVEKDPSKVIIGTKGTNIIAKELYERLLHKYKIQLEMVSKEYGIAMTSIGDTLDGFQRLRKALFEIDSQIERTKMESNEGNVSTKPDEQNLTKLYEVRPMIQIPSIYEAKNRKSEIVTLNKAEGRISSSYVYQYPPGIPVLAPGEMVTSQIIGVLTLYEELGYQLVGIGKDSVKGKSIEVIAQ